MTDPREAEANGQPGTFEFRGETFTVPLEYDDYPLSFIEVASEGASTAIQMRELLGPEQWAKVKAMNLKGRDLKELERAAEKAGGVSEGEGTASSD